MPATQPSASIIGTNQGGATKFAVSRGYYQLLRLMSYLYVVGGWVDDAGAGAPGPTGTIERHQQ